MSGYEYQRLYLRVNILQFLPQLKTGRRNKELISEDSKYLIN